MASAPPAALHRATCWIARCSLLKCSSFGLLHTLGVLLGRHTGSCLHDGFCCAFKLMGLITASCLRLKNSNSEM